MNTKHFASSLFALSCVAIGTPALAGFILEKAPDIEFSAPGHPAATAAATRQVSVFHAQVPQAAAQPAAQPAAAAPSAESGRDINPSARLSALAKKNRQRIDLESRLASRITQSGTPPAELPVMRGLGNDVLFEDALRMILPAGWSAYSDQDLPEGLKVDWQGNRTWPMVLNQILVARDMRAHVDWDAKEVMLFVPAPPAEKPAVVASPQEPQHAPPLTQATGGAAQSQVQTVDVGAPVNAASAPRVEVAPATWRLEKDKTLRENLRTWAAQVGWSLVWNATVGDYVVDYPVEESATLVGDLIGAQGAIAKTMLLYEDAERPLAVEFYRGNRVIVVRLAQVPDAAPGSGRPMEPMVKRVAPMPSESAKAQRETGAIGAPNTRTPAAFDHTGG